MITSLGDAEVAEVAIGLGEMWGCWLVTIVGVDSENFDSVVDVAVNAAVVDVDVAADDDDADDKEGIHGDVDDGKDVADEKDIGADDDIVGKVDISIGFTSVCLDELLGMGWF